MEKVEGSVRLIENFLSWQGEGPDSGRSMIILRFKTCNLKCPWCDTAVKMRISAESPHKLSDIQETIYDTYSGILVTGGEPTVARHFDETLMLLNELDYPVANVETNGHRLLSLFSEVNPTKPIKFIYSPKVFTEHDLENALATVEQIADKKQVFIKVVWETTNPLIQKFVEEVSMNFRDLKWDHRIWLMPEGVTRSDLIRNSEGVFNACEKYRINFSSRSHIIFGFV
jgi:organic radical activating enzyme